MEFKVILTFILCIIILLVFGKKILLPFKSIIKLVINSIIGGGLIFVINLIGASYNFHIGLNIINSIIVGLLGVPGAILLVLFNIFIL